MPIIADHIEDLMPIVELAASFGLTHVQQTQLVESCQRILDAREARDEHSSRSPEIQDTGLGPRPEAKILPLREAERRHLTAALLRTGGKIYGRDGAAKLLDLKPTTLQSKLKKHGIDRLGAAGVSGSGVRESAESSDGDDPADPADIGTRHPHLPVSTTAQAIAMAD